MRPSKLLLIQVFFSLLISPVSFAVDSEWKEEVDESIAELTDIIEKQNELLESYRSGSRKIFFSGNARYGLTAREGENSSMEGILRFHPYWKVSNYMLCKADTQFALLGNKTDVFLFFAMCGFVLNDYMNLKIGKFLTPFGYYQEFTHVEWMIKFPDEPLPIADDILVPTSTLGAALKGVIPLGSSWKLDYSLYGGNGGRLATGSDNPQDAGLVYFDNYADNNENKSVGAHLTLIPHYSTRIGYSYYTAQVGESGTEYSKIHARIQGVDLGFKITDKSIGGQYEIRGEWVSSKVDDASYLNQPVFDNTRDGWVVWTSYRPTIAGNRFWKNAEFLVRYDALDMPDGGPLNDMDRWTFAFDYWLESSVVIKAAYETYNIYLNDYTWASSGTTLIHGIPGQQREFINENQDTLTREAYLIQLAVGY